MPDVSEILAAALEHHQGGRPAEAERLYRQALEADPHEATALYLFGMLSFETGHADRAADLFARLVEARPDHAEGHFALANLNYWRDRRGEAVEGYRRAIQLRPDHASALINLAKALGEQGDFQAAIDAGRLAVDHSYGEPQAQAALGGVLTAAGRYDEAVEVYRSALTLQPDLIEAHVGMATALLSDGRPREALSAADQATRLGPALAETWLARGAALAALGQPAAAAEALEQAVRLDPDRAAAHLNLGNAYAELERAQEAQQHLLRALEIDPLLKEAHASLGSVYVRAGRKAAAELCFQAALAIDVDMVAPHQNLAALLAERGEADEARRHRDLAYGQQNVFVDRAADPLACVLVLTASEGGNIPHRYLLPKDRFTRIDWFVEYAPPGQADELPPYDLVFNAIGDADLAGPTTAPVEAFLAICRRPVLNDPAKVARTHRQMTASRLADVEGLTVPATARLAAAALAQKGLAACIGAAGISPPVLVRPIGSHGGKGLIRAETAADLDEIALTQGQDAYATAYEDFRSSDGWHRKYRAIFVDRRAYPYHLAISPDWLVHYETSGMEADPVRLAEELSFLKDPEAAIGARAWRAVCTIGERLDLDYCGVDFSILPDGRVLVFEANATMLAHPEADSGALAPKNPYVRTILDAFMAMVARAAAG
jgi:tetratricopeptide (TPR) repeat protein